MPPEQSTPANLVMGASAGSAQPRPPSDTPSPTAAGVTVVGTGTAATPVDRVAVSLGVEVQRADAGQAFQAAAATVTTVLAILADHGVDARSVRTADLSLGPRYHYRDGEPARDGYQAAQRMTVTLDGLSTIGTLLTDLAKAVGDDLQIDHVQLATANPREAAADARAAAMIDAREKAAALATLAGRALGAVISVTEIPDVGPGRAHRPMAVTDFSASASTSMPLATGDTAVAASVQVHFAWGD